MEATRPSDHHSSGVDAPPPRGPRRESPRCRHDLAFTWQCLKADWLANQGVISRLVVLVYRFGHLLEAGFLPKAVSRGLWPIYRTLDLVWSKLLAGSDISHTACIGAGL